MIKIRYFSVALACLLALGALSQVAYALYPTTDPWPMWRYNLARTGSTTSTAPNTNKTLWSQAIYYTGTPVVVDGKVIVSAYSKMYALDETTGVKLWESISFPGSLGSALAVEYGRVYVGSSGGYLYALNTSTGDKLWEYQATTASGGITTAPAVANGRVYFGTVDNYLYAIDAFNGAFYWRYGGAALAPIYSTPAVDGTWIYFGADDGKVRALNDTGPAPALKWTYPTAGQRVRCAPAVGDGMVFFSAYYPEYSLFAVDKTTGQHIWKYTMSSYGENSPAFSGGIVYYTNYYTYKAYALYANALPGNYTETDPAIRKWSTTVGYYPTNPVVADGKVFFGAGDKKLYALDVTDGHIIWTYEFPTYSPEEPIVADGRIFVSTYYGLTSFGSPYPPLTYDYTVNVLGYTFIVRLVINATPGQFNIAGLTTLKKISYTLEGISGTIGMSNITIPNEMLGGPYTVTVDGGLPDSYSEVTNGTHTSLYFTYLHSVHTVEITGTTVIAEFPGTAIFAVLIFATLTGSLYTHYFKRHKKLQA